MKPRIIFPIIFNFSNSQFDAKFGKAYLRFVNSFFEVLSIIISCKIPNFFFHSPQKNTYNKDAPLKLQEDFKFALITKKLVTDDGEKLIDVDNIILLDINNGGQPIDSRNVKALLTYINSLMCNAALHDGQVAFIIIANRIFSIEDDFQNSEFFQFVEKGNVLLLSHKGELSNLTVTALYGKTLVSEYKEKVKSVFKSQYKIIFGDALEKFKKKLVGFVGHFPREINGQIDRCHFYFYDGKYCQKELKEILLGKLKALRPDYLIVDCAESPWLFQPVYMAVAEIADGPAIQIIRYDEKLEIHEQPVPVYKEELRSHISKIPGDKKVLLLFDLIHHGNRLEKVVTDVRSLNNALSIEYHTVIRAINDTETDKPLGEFELRGIKILPYHEVRQKDVIQAHCDYCNKYNIPYNDKDDLDSIELTTPNFWMLCNQSKYRPEKNPPTYRPPLRAVPNFPKMLWENGAFIALKIKELLLKSLHLNEEQLSNITFIGPNEEGTQAISTCLSSFMDVELILIDKEAIKTTNSKNYNANEILTNFESESWCNSLYDVIGTGKTKEIIIFDEFCVTDNTLKNYYNFAKRLDFTVRAFFPIFRFNEIPDIDGIPIYSLYNFGLKSSHYSLNHVKPNTEPKLQVPTGGGKKKTGKNKGHRRK